MALGDTPDGGTGQRSVAGHLGAGWSPLHGLGRRRWIRRHEFRGASQHGLRRIEGPPESYRGVNVNGGKDPQHPASFPNKGKTGGILFVDGILYARLNLQDGPWPDVNHSLAWSEDRGATWQQTSWVFPKGEGNFKPARFLNFGQDYAGVPSELAGYIYIYGFKQTGAGAGDSIYLSRVPRRESKTAMRTSSMPASTPSDHSGLPTWTTFNRYSRTVEA